MSFNQSITKIKENEEYRTKSTPIAMVAPELKQNADTEITKTCAVLGCEESKNLDSELFFRFPEDENLRQIWADLTGRNNWTPTDYSYICIEHFSVDCFVCNSNDQMVLTSNAVPSLKLPKHVLEVEYIDEETLDNEALDTEYEDEDYLMDSDDYIDDELLNNEVSPKILPNTAASQEKTVGGIEYLNHDGSIRKLSHTTRVEKISPEKREFLKKISKYSSSLSNRADSNKFSNILRLDKTERKSEENRELKRGLSNKPLNNYSIHKERQLTRKSSENSIDRLKSELSVKSQSNSIQDDKTTETSGENLELLKLFTDVQRMQCQAAALKEKLKSRTRIYKRQDKFLSRVKEVIEMKTKILNQKKKKKSRILLSLQDKIAEDTNGLVLAMPTRHSDDLKNFALSIYKYSPQAYIYIRNTLRTLLPTSEILESWISSGFEPKNVMNNSNLIKVASELTDSELTCKVTLR